MHVLNEVRADSDVLDSSDVDDVLQVVYPQTNRGRPIGDEARHRGDRDDAARRSNGRQQYLKHYKLVQLPAARGRTCRQALSLKNCLLKQRKYFIPIQDSVSN